MYKVFVYVLVRSGVFAAQEIKEVIISINFICTAVHMYYHLLLPGIKSDGINGFVILITSFFSLNFL